MGSILSIIHLPAQSGKTRKMTELINRWKQLIDITGNSSDNINIIFTSNTKLLTKQTANRIHKEVDNGSDVEILSEISDLSIDEDFEFSIDMDIKEKESKTIAWISSAKKVTINDIFAKVTSDDEDEISNIICCTNKSRMKSAWELLLKLNKKFIKGNLKKQVNIWIDEADACIKIWGSYLNTCSELISSNFIQNIVLVSATMVPVYKFLHAKGIDPNLRTFEDTHSPMYHKYSDSDIIHTFSDNSRNALCHLRDILENNEDVNSPGTRLFCPGNKAKKSHEEVCDLLITHGFNVLILNGIHKEIRFCDGRPPIEIAEQLETDLEVSLSLNKFYYEQELFTSPFAVTGNLCIGRGITFASKVDEMEFLFTHGIIPEIANGDEGYQMVARCCGNITEFESFQIPKIFVSLRTHNLICAQENLAIEFAKKFFQKDVVEPMVKVTRKMLKEAIGDEADVPTREERRKEREENSKFIVGSTVEFDTLEEANQFCKKIKKGSRMEKESDFQNELGLFPCTTTKKGAKVFSYEDFMCEAASWNKTSLLNMGDLTSGKVSKVIKPVYKGDKVVWLVRWAIDVMKAPSVDKPNVSEELIAEAIRNNKYEIKCVSPQHFQLNI